MATLTLMGDASGAINLTVPAAAGSHTITLPAATGTALLSSVTMNFPTTLGASGDVLTTDGAGNLSWTAVSGTGTVTSVASTLAGITVINPSTTPSLGGVLLPASGGTGITSLGAGVATALGAAAGGPNGFATLDVSGITPVAQGGTGLGALGAGVQTALGNAAGGNNGFALLGGTGILPFAQGGTGLNTLGTAGQVLTVNGGGTAMIWTTPSSGTLTVGTTSIASGTTGSLLIQTGTTLQEITMGSGVAAALTNATNAANGVAVLDGSGILPVAQGGTGLSSVGSGVQSALTANTNTAGGLPTLDLSGFLPVAQGGTGTATANSNTFFAGPLAGAAAAPSFRAIDFDDLAACFLANASSSGYQKLPSGLIIQWGSSGVISAPTGAVTINFPMTFPNAPWIVVASPSIGGNNFYPVSAANYSPSGFNAYIQNGSINWAFTYIAIGG